MMGSASRASFEAVDGKAEELPEVDLRVTTTTKPGAVSGGERQGCHYE